MRGAPAGTRVRVAVLDRYDGNRWYAANDTSPTDFSDRFLRVSSRIDNPADGEEQLFTFFVRHRWDLPWVPTIGAMQAFEFYDDYASDRLPDLRYNRATDTALLPGGLDLREDYVISAIPVADRLGEKNKPWPTPDTTLQDAAAFLDVPAQAWSLGARTDMQAVFAMADELRRARPLQRRRLRLGDPLQGRPGLAPPRRGLRQRAGDGRQRRAVRRHDGAARQPHRRAGARRGGHGRWTATA